MPFRRALSAIEYPAYPLSLPPAVAIKILNIDYDDPGSFSFETLVSY